MKRVLLALALAILAFAHARAEAPGKGIADSPNGTPRYADPAPLSRCGLYKTQRAENGKLYDLYVCASGATVAIPLNCLLDLEHPCKEV